MNILLTDDDDALRSALAENLRRQGWTVVETRDVRGALQNVPKADVLVTDVKLPDANGIELLSRAREERHDLEVIVMTGYASIPSAVDAMRRGARTYIAKPFEPEELILHLREVEEKLRLKAAAGRGGRGALVGVGPAMRKVFSAIDAAAAARGPVLVVGATGTGKELAAAAVHELSARRAAPFIAVNVAALPRELLESELFGHERGAFTGAHAKKKGRFDLAHGGSLFLDEIDSLPIDLQPKLLRAIEAREIWPLGAEKSHTVDARIIAATNADLESRIKAAAFREDLFYRLNVLRIELPRLEDRPEDISVLAQALLERYRLAEDMPRLALSAEALSTLVTRPWPGNVRELANVLERAAGRAAADAGPQTVVIRIEAAHLDAGAAPAVAGLPFRQAKNRAIEEWSRKTIAAALAASDGNAAAAARKLRMGRTALLRLMKKFSIR